MKNTDNTGRYVESNGVLWEKTDDTFTSSGLEAYISGPSNQNRALFVRNSLKKLAEPSDKSDDIVNAKFIEECVDLVVDNITAKLNK